ncbi:hypothetical protein P8629_02780 [Hydrogenovibrio sp. 3SP14C1]|uniref:hypothetical protein n=1 Tax=Hydrogenovibrio sp. 3SP14C1 TaxID=3038774 RepID=UPI002417ED3C|nr:hypothetical protein [Hydrogenovibrio sp. 3SP14C1]MDG4811922.1 hypothetical protein [Hydrogenovibrio sp. 3SP14C1]
MNDHIKKLIFTVASALIISVIAGAFNVFSERKADDVRLDGMDYRITNNSESIKQITRDLYKPRFYDDKVDIKWQHKQK